MNSGVKEIRQAIYKAAGADKKRFIESFLKIEDKDNEAVAAVPFKLWDGQRDVLEQLDGNRLNIILKARQLGLTWLCLAYALCEMISKAGYLVIAISRTETEAKELIRRFTVLLENAPSLFTKDYRTRDGRIRYEKTALEIKLIREDGAASVIKAFTSSASTARSFTANLLFLDEWAFQQYAREIWTSAFPTINRPTGGKVIGISTIERGSLFEELFTGAPENGFNRVFLPWYTDPRRDEKWYTAARAALGELVTQEYPATVEEALTVPGGAYFPEFNERIHTAPIRAIPAEYNRYVAIDYGLDMFAAVFAAMDTKGDAVIYREIHQSGLIASEAARKLKTVMGGDEITAVFAPSDLWSRHSDTGRSTAEIFYENGIDLVRVSNTREHGCINVKEYLKPVYRIDEQTGRERETAALTVFRDCAPELTRCIKLLQKDKRNPNEYANEPHELTHIVDALRYLCCGRPMATAVKPVKDYDIVTDEEQIDGLLDFGRD